MERSISKPVPDDEEWDVEEAVPENKLSQKSSGYAELLLTSFTTRTYDMDTGRKAGGGSLLYRNIFREMKKQKSQKLQCISIELHGTCLPLPLLLPPLPALRRHG